MQSNKLTKQDIKVIGVTGGIGSGKSTVSRILADFGGRIVDADTVSKELMRQGQAGFEAVLEHFGRGILGSDGEIHREKLGTLVFQDSEKRLQLNALIHPLVGKEIRTRVDQLKEELSSAPLHTGELRFIVLDVPIPVEDGFFDVSNCVWTVAANDDLRIQRIMERNGVSEQEAEQRILSQMSNREYMEIADVIIENERDLDALRSFVAKELVHYFDIDTDAYTSQKV